MRINLGGEPFKFDLAAALRSGGQEAAAREVGRAFFDDVWVCYVLVLGVFLLEERGNDAMDLDDKWVDFSLFLAPFFIEFYINVFF